MPSALPFQISHTSSIHVDLEDMNDGHCQEIETMFQPIGSAQIRHSLHEIVTQPSHSVDRAGWQAKMASIEFWIPCRIAHRLHWSTQAMPLDNPPQGSSGYRQERASGSAPVQCCTCWKSIPDKGLTQFGPSGGVLTKTAQPFMCKLGFKNRCTLMIVCKLVDMQVLERKCWGINKRIDCAGVRCRCQMQVWERFQVQTAKVKERRW